MLIKLCCFYTSKTVYCRCLTTKILITPPTFEKETNEYKNNPKNNYYNYHNSPLHNTHIHHNLTNPTHTHPRNIRLLQYRRSSYLRHRFALWSFCWRIRRRHRRSSFRCLLGLYTLCPRNIDNKRHPRRNSWISQHQTWTHPKHNPASHHLNNNRRFHNGYRLFHLRNSARHTNPRIRNLCSPRNTSKHRPNGNRSNNSHPNHTYSTTAFPTV